jgi:Stigma-specific protein, Stig1
MLHVRFASLSRDLRSRRTAIGGLALALTALMVPPAEELAASRKRTARCPKTLQHKKCGKNKKCVNTLTHPDHCGGCKNRCDEGVDCIRGICGGPVDPA